MGTPRPALYVFVPHPVRIKAHDSVSWLGWFSACALPGSHTLVLAASSTSADQVPLPSRHLDDTVWRPVGPGCDVAACFGATPTPPVPHRTSFVFQQSKCTCVVLDTHASHGLPAYHAVHVVSYNPRDVPLEVCTQVSLAATHSIVQGIHCPSSPLTTALHVLAPRPPSARFVDVTTCFSCHAPCPAPPAACAAPPP